MPSGLISMVPYSSPAIVTTDCGIKTDESGRRHLYCGADDGLFLSVRQHPKHANGHGAAVVANVPLVDVELDRRRRCERTAAVFLVLDFVMIAFPLEHVVTHESPCVRH